MTERTWAEVPASEAGSTSVQVVVPGAFLAHFEGSGAGQGDLKNECPEGVRLHEIYNARQIRTVGRGRSATFTFTLPADQESLDYLTEMADAALGFDDDPALKRAARLVVERGEKAGASAHRRSAGLATDAVSAGDTRRCNSIE